jgi:transcription elongation factor/antiterminator RfaH
METEHDMNKWIAVYTKPRHERTAKSELETKGFEVFLPLLKERRKCSDRKKWVEFPLFKSYIFVRTETKNVLFVLQTPGVVTVVKFGGEVAIVQDKSIQAIKLMIEGGYRPIATDYFVKGDPVQVKEGPLKGLVGEVTRIDGHDRLLIRVDAIQHSVSVHIDRAFLKSI